MPDVVITNDGAHRLLTSGTRPTHLQFGSVTLPAEQWASRSMVAGAFRTVPLQHAIVSAELQMIGVDDDDAQAYDNFASLGVWIGEPTDGASTLMAFGTAPPGATYGAKEVDNDLEVSANATLTASQLGNVVFDHAVTLNMSEIRFGLGRLATRAEALEGLNDVGLMTSLKNKQWWDALTSVPDAKIPALPQSRITGLATALAAKADAIPSVTALVDGGNIAWNLNGGLVASVTLGGNRTLSVPTGGIDNVLYLLRVTQDASGSRTLALHQSIDKGRLIAPTLSTAANSTDLLAFMKWGGTVHYLGALREY